jgi:hypothetical protein
MHETGGREINEREKMRGMNAGVQGYGQQLGWHAYQTVAGQFLAKYPVVQSEYDDEDPWHEWLNRQLLTRRDGLWLADGIHRPPLSTQENLIETVNKEDVLTGNKAKLLALLNIKQSNLEHFVAAGYWHSSDKVRVCVSSAVVSPKNAELLAKELAAEDPFMAWIPRLEENDKGEEYSHGSKDEYIPRIVWPSVEGRLDGRDPLGAISAVDRPHFSKDINMMAGLNPTDSFRRSWVDSHGEVMATSEAWGRTDSWNEENSKNGERLICNCRLLEKVLKTKNAELLLLVVLRRYKRGFSSEPSKYWHSSAVIRVKRTLKFVYFAGATNQLHKSKF